MGWGLLVFACLALLLESGGLYDWAQRLDIGPERAAALPIATALHHALAPLRLERLRTNTLAGLARIRWSDDAAAVENAAGNSEAPTPSTQPNAAVAPPPPTNATSSLSSAAPGSTAPGSTAPGTTAPSGTSPVTSAGPTPEALPGIAGTVPLSSKLPEIAPVAPASTRTVALAGDSMMAVGLSSTILRQAPQYKQLTFVKVFKSGTGLARPEVYNWQREYPAMLKDAKPDVVLVAIGANDGQGFVEDGKTYMFGTEDWQRIYERRVADYLHMLLASGAKVVWLGLPPMKSDSYDAKIAMVSRIQYSVVNATPGATWFSTAALVGDGSGRFRDYGEVAGHTVRLRQGDGIHISDEGASLVVAKLMPWLAAQASAVLPAPAPAAGAAQH